MKLSWEGLLGFTIDSLLWRRLFRSLVAAGFTTIMACFGHSMPSLLHWSRYVRCKEIRRDYSEVACCACWIKQSIERVGGWVCEWVTELLSEWTSEPARKGGWEWTSEPARKGEREGARDEVNEWMTEWAKGSLGHLLAVSFPCPVWFTSPSKTRNVFTLSVGPLGSVDARHRTQRANGEPG